MSLFDTFIGQEPLAVMPKRVVYLAIRRETGQIGDGSSANPYNCATQELFDEVLRELEPQPNTRFIFGPGIFRTRGGPRDTALDPFGFPVRDSQEFIGSGMNQTIVRLTLPPGTILNSIGAGYPVFRALTAVVNNIVISDLTIDLDFSNLAPSSPYDWPRYAVGAIGLTGSNIQIRRVKCINFGTGTPFYDHSHPLLLTKECFPINILATSNSPDNKNNVIENCIVEQPYHSNGRETTCISITGGGQNASGRIYNQFPVLRNNLIDCARINPGPFPKIKVRSLFFGAGEGLLTTDFQHDLKDGDQVIITGTSGGTYDGAYTVKSPGGYIDEWNVKLDSALSGTATGQIFAEKFSQPTMRALVSWNFLQVTVTTTVPHNRKPNDWFTITGATPDRFNGTFQVGSVPTPYTFIYSVISIDSGTATGEIWLDKVHRSFRIQPKTIEQNANTLKITTETPHFWKPGQYAFVARIYALIYPAIIPSESGVPYNGVFKVRDVLSPTQFSFDIDFIDWVEADEIWDDLFLSDEFLFGPPLGNPPGLGIPGIGPSFQALTIYSGKAGIVENNRVLNCPIGFYADTGSNEDVIIRNNYFYNVLYPIRDGIEEFAAASQISGTSSTGSSTITAPTGNLLAGDGIAIWAKAGSPTFASRYYATILTVSVGSFTINTAAQSTGDVWIALLNHVQSYIFENNIMDMMPTLAGADYGGANGSPCGISLSGIITPNNWFFRSVRAVGNITRDINGVADTSTFACGIGINATQYLATESNIIDVKTPSVSGIAISHQDGPHIGITATFNNTDSSGQLIRPYDFFKKQHIEGIEDEIDDMLLGF